MSRALVGRDAECATLREWVMARHEGPRPVVLVTGEAGAGKTSLVEHVLATTGTPALRGRAPEWGCTAHEALTRALRPIAGTGAPPAPGSLTHILAGLGAPPAGPGPAALAAAVCRVLADATAGPASDPLAAGTPAASTPAGNTPAANGSGDDGLARRPRLALFVDDLQWADEATLSLLPALAEAAGGLPVVIIGCYRSDELPRGHRVRAVRALLRRNRLLAEIELGPLGEDDVARMLTALLGAAPRPALTAVVASRADGLPLAVEELALTLREGGRLAYTGGGVALAGAAAAPIPDGIREAVLLRTSRLSDAERALVETAAVAGSEFDVDAVLGAAGVAAWPDGFTGSGLLTEARDGRAGFRHALMHEAAYADIPWPRRRRLHRALAGALAAEGAPPALVAVHHLAARDFGPAREALVAAAEEHSAAHAYADAARALRTALEHWPAGDEEGRLAVIDRLARCAEMCSEYADAVTLLRELAGAHRRRGDLRALASAGRRLALAHELCGQWEPALAAREEAATAFSAAGLPAEAAVDRLAVAAHLRSAASFSAALTTLRAARADAEASGRADLLLRAQGLRGNVLARLGKPREGIAELREALDLALAGELPETAAELQQRLADSLEMSGDYRAATAAYAAAYQYCDTHGADTTAHLCRACATAVLFASGEWDRAVGVCEDVLASAELPHALAAATGILGLIQAMRGAAAQARPHLVEAGLIATRIELTAMELLSSWGLCVLDDAAGAHGEAADRARQILARLARTQERHYSVPVLQWAASFFAERGLPDGAHACAAALAQIAEATALPEAVASLAHARGETLLADEPAVAARELAKAAEMLGALNLPLAAALAQRRAAAAALRLGERARARELLNAAHGTADRLGARQLRARCAAELRPLGGRPRRRAPAAAGLTGRELDVMQLVAQGHTSKQIGSALFISPRTVEMHVQSSMLKLGCRTRAQAVRRLADLDALPAPGVP